MKTHYDNLKVARNAPPEVIRAAYKALCQKYHPDKYAGGAEAADRIMKIINAAYAVLSDPIKRKEYDQTLDDMDALDEEESSGESSQQDAAPEDEAKPKAQQDAYASEAKAGSPPDGGLPILRPALTGALWLFVLGFSNAHKLPAGNYGLEFFCVALASGALGATMGFCVVIVVQWVRRLSGALPSTPSRINILLDTFAPIKSLSEAEADLKVACFDVVGIEILVLVLKWLAESPLGVIGALLMASLAWWCYQKSSATAAFLLVTLSLIDTIFTGVIRFTGMEGGSNLFMAATISIGCVFVLRAAEYIQENTKKAAQPDPPPFPIPSPQEQGARPEIVGLIILAVLIFRLYSGENKSYVSSAPAAAQSQPSTSTTGADDYLASPNPAVAPAGQAEGQRHIVDPSAQPPSASPNTASERWLQRNPWFKTDHERARFAIEIETRLQAEGFSVSDDGLYRELDRRLKLTDEVWTSLPYSSRRWLVRSPWYFTDAARAKKADALARQLSAEGYQYNDAMYNEIDRRMAR